MEIVIRNQTYYLEILVTDENGNYISELEYINYRIFRSDNDVLTVSGSLINVGDGIYKEEVKFSDIGQYRVFYNLPDGYPDTIQGIMVVENELEKIKDDVNFIKNIESGKWELRDDQMTFYAFDNETELVKFNLFDSFGNPSMKNIFKRERV